LTVAVAGGPATAVVGLAAAPRARSPLGGGAPLRALATAESVVPIRLVHGTADPVVPADRSVEFAHACRAAGLPCELRLVDTDHAGIVGTEYDPERGHCVPSTSDAARRGLAAAVAAVAELRDS
jgi:acetyl esterase/lipase